MNDGGLGGSVGGDYDDLMGDDLTGCADDVDCEYDSIGGDGGDCLNHDDDGAKVNCGHDCSCLNCCVRVRNYLVRSKLERWIRALRYALNRHSKGMSQRSSGHPDCLNLDVPS